MAKKVYFKTRPANGKFPIAVVSYRSIQPLTTVAGKSTPDRRSLGAGSNHHFSFKLIRIFFSSSDTASLIIVSVSIRSCTVRME